MKNIALVAISALAIFTVSCRDTEKGSTTTIIKEKTVTPAGTTEKKGIFEKVGDAVDNRVNKEVDEEIKRIED